LKILTWLLQWVQILGKEARLKLKSRHTLRAQKEVKDSLNLSGKSILLPNKKSEKFKIQKIKFHLKAQMFKVRLDQLDHGPRAEINNLILMCINKNFIRFAQAV